VSRFVNATHCAQEHGRELARGRARARDDAVRENEKRADAFAKRSALDRGRTRCPEMPAGRVCAHVGEEEYRGHAVAPTRAINPKALLFRWDAR